MLTYVRFLQCRVIALNTADVSAEFFNLFSCVNPDSGLLLDLGLVLEGEADER